MSLLEWNNTLHAVSYLSRMVKILSTLYQYVLNTSFHGYRYLVQKNIHWTERVFWLICCILSGYGSGLLIQASWDDFKHNAISFVVETSYLDWDTNFPTVVICESDNQQRIAAITDKLYGDPHDYNLDEIVKELVYFKGLSFYTLQICGTESGSDGECIRNNFSIFSPLVRSECKELVQHCMWNKKDFDCCHYFRVIDTELGMCYALNSRQSREKSVPFLPLISNKKTGPGTLYLEIFGFVNVFILGEQEVPSLSTLQTDIIQMTPHIHYRRYMTIKEIENQPEVRDVSIDQRNCRFMEENDGIDVSRQYSFSACCVQCRKDAQLKTCGCTHHLMPNTSVHLHCDIKGLECLSNHYDELSVLKPYWSNRTGLVCNCMPSCTEVEMTIIKDEKYGIQDEFAKVEISLDRLPSERYKRNVIKGKLDLVVSMGGTTALFLGASILSFVEVIYYFIVRPLSDYFIAKNEKTRTFKKHEIIIVKDPFVNCFPYVD